MVYYRTLYTKSKQDRLCRTMNANGSHYNIATSTGTHHNGLSRSLPPISSMDSYRQQLVHSPPNEYHTMPPRHLPAPYSSMPGMSVMPRHDNIPSRPIYPGATAYQMPPGRMALPPSSDPNLMIAGRAHKTKEVKRRTKTGCMTCRKRRIKVRAIQMIAFPFSHLNLIASIPGLCHYSKKEAAGAAAMMNWARNFCMVCIGDTLYHALWAV